MNDNDPRDLKGLSPVDDRPDAFRNLRTISPIDGPIPMPCHGGIPGVCGVAGDPYAIDPRAHREQASWGASIDAHDRMVGGPELADALAMRDAIDAASLAEVQASGHPLPDPFRRLVRT